MVLLFYIRRGGSDQLKAGEISLFDITPEEQAKARLVATRKRRRDHKVLNLEKIREKDRARHYRKKALAN
jgi:hypothetical protein